MFVSTLDSIQSLAARPPTHRASRPPRLVFTLLDGVATIRIPVGPPSTWAASRQACFRDALARAVNEGAAGVVLMGRDMFRDHPAGAARLKFNTVTAALADCPLPVVACLEDHAEGPGLELALACDARVSGPDATLALPEVHRGAVPCNGALLRLAACSDLGVAVRLAVFGERIGAEEARAAGLTDAVAGRDLGRAARRLALSFSGKPCRARPARALKDADLFDARLELKRRGGEQAAPILVLRALEAALRLSPQAAAVEIARLAEELQAHPQAAALAYAHAAADGLSDALAEAWALRLRWPWLREAVHLLDEGATPAQVDRALNAYGFACGPFALSDRRGLMPVFSLDGQGPVEGESWNTYSPTLDLMLDARRHGGAEPGWYRPAAGAPGAVSFDPAVERLLQASATFQRLRRAPMTDEQITERCLLAAINGAADLLGEPGAPSAERLDAIWATRLGFPRWKGGPLFQADRLGARPVVERLEALRRQRDTAGRPAPALARCAQDGAALTRPAA